MEPVTQKLYEPTPLFGRMVQFYLEMRAKKERAVICNEGGTGSGKTYAEFDLIYAMCDQNRGENLSIYIMRDTLVNCRDYTLIQWKEWLHKRGIFEKKNLVENPKPKYKLFGTDILFRGFSDDEKGEGFTSDIAFVNEALDCRYSDIEELERRNKIMLLIDWNPKYTEKELFSWEKRSNTRFFKTTYKNNIKNLDPKRVKTIESWSPWLLEDCKIDARGNALIPEKNRRPHIENLKQGTAKKWDYQVYGMGMRANKEGLVFPDVTWIDTFPKIMVDNKIVDDVEEVIYGLDFGETAPSAFVKLGYKHGEVKSDLYLEIIFYKPTPTADHVIDMLLQTGLTDLWIWADSNKLTWINQIRHNPKIMERHIQMSPVSKKGGQFRSDWITNLKRFNLNLVRNRDLQAEQENFCIDDDSREGKDIKKHDHAWSAFGYAAIMKFKYK